jgi:electron transfer flavoprotein alpha subunit
MIKPLTKDETAGICVVAEIEGTTLHMVSLELLGKAVELSKKLSGKITCLIYGHEVTDLAHLALAYGAQEVVVLDHRELDVFRSDIVANLAADAIHTIKPAIVLVGATPIGRSLAPRMAAILNTGLTADCTELDISEQGDLIQRRPAWGGNIMADILTPQHRPQMASVRPKIFSPIPEITNPIGSIRKHGIDPQALLSGINVLSRYEEPATRSISDAQRIVVAGIGVADAVGLDLVHALADRLQAAVAYTRPLIERGIGNYTHQIGLSGRSVAPELLITCGVSGSVQFAAGMTQSRHIIAINTDPDAEIFSVAHVGVVGDCYEVIPKWIEALDQGELHV